MSSSQPSPRVLLLGDTSSSEMQICVEAIRSLLSAAEIHSAIDVPSFITKYKTEKWFPDLAIVFQNWPEEYSSADLEKLMCVAPLARWVCCYGIWCEADGRNLNIWPPAWRVQVRAA